MPSSVVALFCDDIRTEEGGQYTLIGVLPDNIAVPRLPVSLPKLAIFIRAQLETANPPKEFLGSLKNSEGVEYPGVPQWNEEISKKGSADAARHKSPIYGLIGTIIYSPFSIKSPGQIICSVTIDGIVYVAGILNVILEPPTASAPPSSQSPSSS